MSNLVVTGATGFLGSALVDELEARGELAGSIALCRTPAPQLAARGMDVRVGSLLDPAFVQAALPAGCRIIHIAGQVSFMGADTEQLARLHVDATRVLVDAALARDVARFVLLSTSGTSAVSTGPRVHTEADLVPMDLIGRWPYYMTKFVQERLVLDHGRRRGLPAIVLNPTMLLGPGDERTSTALVEDFLHGRIPVVPRGGLSIVDSRDVAAMLHGALARGRIGERYLLGSYNGSFAEFFEILGRVAGKPGPALPALPGAAGKWLARLANPLLRRVDPALAEAVGWEKSEFGAHFWYLDATKARQELGFQPRPMEATLRDTVAYARARRTSAGA